MTTCASRVMPALFTRMSTGPTSPHDGLEKTGDGCLVGDVAPAGPDALPASAPAARSTSRAASSPERYVIATAAPRSASSSAIPRPMPREPPVTTATRPERSKIRRHAVSTGDAPDLYRSIKLLAATQPPTRSTALTSAPPDATLLISTSGPGAGSARRAMRSPAHAGSDALQTGDRRHEPAPSAQERGHARRRARRARFSQRAFDRRDNRAAAAEQRFEGLRLHAIERARIGRGIHHVDRLGPDIRLRERLGHDAGQRFRAIGPLIQPDGRAAGGSREQAAVRSSRPAPVRPPRSRARARTRLPRARSRFAWHRTGGSLQVRHSHARAPRTDRARSRRHDRRRPRRRRSAPARGRAAGCPTACAIAASPDASFWLMVTFGPRSFISRPARLAAMLATVALKMRAGAPVGPSAKRPRRNSSVGCPPAV